VLGKGNGSFDQSVAYDAHGDGPGSIVAGYFNGDKIIDLAVTNEKSDSISILLGNGDGTFLTSHFMSANGPCSVATRDFNQDRKADLAIVNNVSNTLSIFLGEGYGMFTHGYSYALPGEPRAITAGDFNKDGKPDLAIINYISYYYSSRIALFLGNGDDEGSFVEAGTYSAGMYSLSIKAADINGDEKTDLLFINMNEDNFSVLINNTPAVVASDFSFAPAVHYTVGNKPRSIAIADFDGDSDLDLVVANSGSNNVSVLMGLDIYTGTFTVATNFPAGGRPLSVVAADFNGDKAADIAVANEASNDVSILLGQGTGLFDEAVTYTAVGMEGPCSLIAARLNDDAKMDLAIASKSSDSSIVHIMLAAGNTKAGNLFSTPILIRVPEPTSIFSADFNYDENPDLAITSGSEDSVYIKYGDADCKFNIPFKYYEVGRGPSSITVADFDGDETSDIAVSNELSQDVSILLGYRKGNFGRTESYEVGKGISSIISADMNGDGRVDLVTANDNIALLAGRGDGTFAPPFFYEAGDGSCAVGAADFNGDERVDLAVANKDSNSVTVLINNTPAIIVTPTSGLVTDESGSTADFTVVLTAKPIVDVTINFICDETEGEVLPPAVTFTSRNWDIEKSVTVMGVDDDSVDGDVRYTIVTSPAVVVGLEDDVDYYNRRECDDITVTNLDNDRAGITVDPLRIMTTEESGAGAEDAFTIVLNTKPESDVTVDILNSNETEGILSVPSITFTPDDWNIPKEVKVLGLDDQIDDGDIAYDLIVGPALSADTHYNGLDPDDVTVTNRNNDSARIKVYPESGLITSEDGSTDTFEIVLNSEPKKDVMLSISSDDKTEGLISPKNITFSPTDWNIPQIVTITGIDDNLVDRDVQYAIIIEPSLSNDQTYNGLDPNDVYVTNVDNDTAGILVSPTSGLETSEEGDTDSFTISLTSQPTSKVVIGLESSNEEEGAVPPQDIVFTAANWNTPQRVTITGVDDSIIDGHKEYIIIVAPIVSDDTDYNGLNPDDVSVVNYDNEVAAILITPVKGLVTMNGGSATFAVVLAIKPKADVSFSLTSSDEKKGTVSPANLTFTPANWDKSQIVTVTGKTAASADEDNSYTIITWPAVSDDDDYYGINPVDITINDPNSLSDPNSPGGGTVGPTTEEEEVTVEEEVKKALGCFILSIL
ncbi:MAG: FG-GAP repeat domain-containing protein, partial [bacterium]